MKIKDITLSNKNRDKFNISTSGDVTIPGFVTDPDTGELCRVTALSSDLFSADKDYWTPLGADALSYKIRSIIVPPTVTGIPNGCFAGFYNLLKIILPDNITELSSYVFYKCTTLVDVTLPASLKVIRDSAFRGCYSIKELKLPSSVKKIETYAFVNCCKLTDIVIPPNVEYIDVDAFKDVPHIYYHGNLPGAPWGAKRMN